jgi:hypothetical protein
MKVLISVGYTWNTFQRFILRAILSLVYPKIGVNAFEISSHLTVRTSFPKMNPFSLNVFLKIRYLNAPSKSISLPLPLRPPENLTLLSWNIDGLDERNLRLRTKAVCK